MNKKPRSQPLRYENSDEICLCTTRTINSRLWFVNNKTLENRILGYLAKYQNKYGVILYAFNIQGNHIHLVAKFPNNNRAAFFKDFNARIAESVRHCVQEFEGGPLWGRRYSCQTLPLPIDAEDYFFYCALQPVSAGITKKISEYPGYNSFHHASSNIQSEYKVIRWSDYKNHKRHNPKTRIQDYTETYKLKYSRLPGYLKLSQKEYKNKLLIKLENRRQKIIAEHRAKGYNSYYTKEELMQIIPGSKPRKTKKGDKIPLVLSRSKEAKEVFLTKYFSILASYLKASLKYLAGDVNAKFPPGTYKPPGPFVSLSKETT